MSELNRVTVTVTPNGIVHDFSVGGYSIGSAVRIGDAELRLGASGDYLPQLAVVFVPDEIIVKGD